MGVLARFGLVGLVALGTWPGVPRDPTSPVRIVRAVMYTDGGTVGFEARGFLGMRIVGGFDGRIEGATSDFPKHCFVGALQASQAGARLLPLHGHEERALVRLLDRALRNQLPFGMWRRLLETGGAADVPKGIDPGLGPLVQRVEARRLTLERVDRGDWFGREKLRAESGTVEWVELEADSPGEPDAAIRVTVRIQGKHVFRYSFPSESSGRRGPSRWLMTRGKHSDCIFGSLMDRRQTLWTILALENAAAPPDPLAIELRELLEARLRLIREDDEKR